MTHTENIRNVALVGHHGTGKTSLAEALLYRAGVRSRVGSIDDGTTALDVDPEEHERRHSLALSVATFEWQGHRINLLDTPGSPDFVGDALMAMQVADLAVFVLDAVAGVQPQDITLWRRAGQMNLPRMIFVNKLDREHAEFQNVVAQVREAFGPHADPVELPIGEESSFHGIADLLTDVAFVYDTGHAEQAPIPDDLVDAEQEEHSHLVEEIVETDDELLEQYLEGNEPSPEELEARLHDAVDRALVFPVLCGSAITPIGADHLADLICRVGPAPGDAGPTPVRIGGEDADLVPDPSGQPVVFVFKTTVDDYLGQISLFRVMSGTIRPDDVLINARTGEKERFHQVLLLTGDGHTASGEIPAGSIAAVTKLSDTATADTLRRDASTVEVVAPVMSDPVHGIAIKAAAQSQENRMSAILKRLVTEDPTLSVSFDANTRQTVLGGNGDTHVQVALSRLARAGVEVETDDVQVAYRETLAGPIETEGKYKKQSGGHGQFGVAMVRFEPLPLGSGFEFDTEVTGGAIPRNLIPAVGHGIEESMQRGGRYGFPLVDLRAVCVDGKHHSVDSSEMSFKMAGSLALRAAIEKVGVEVIEPVSEIRVNVPSEHQGDVLGDLTSRRAQVLGAEGEGDHTTIIARVPTSEIGRYSIQLSSMTSGRGSCEIRHDGYQLLPAALRDRLAKDAED